MASCPLCRSASIETKYRTILPLPALGEVQVSFGICRDCGHIGQLPPPPASLMKKHYELFSNYTILDAGYAPAAAPPVITQRLLALANQLRPQRGSIYEVGCATGLHLYYFKKDGWKVGGCDPSLTAAAQAKALHGVDVDRGWEETCLPRLRPPPDVVLYAHVIEHLYAPLATLARTRQVLGRQGLLLFELPCVIDAPSLPSGWFIFEHVNYFSPGTLLNLLRRAGFEPVELRVTPADRSGLHYPVMTVAACSADSRLELSPCHAASREFVDAFLERDRNLWAQTQQVVSTLDEPVYVWSAGVRTAQLFAHTNIRNRPGIIALIDSDAQKWRLRQSGYTILSPEEFFVHAERAGGKVVIGSYSAEEAIYRHLKSRGVPDDRIIRIYPDRLGPQPS
jgi:SAM-dependent methyltransferase